MVFVQTLTRAQAMNLVHFYLKSLNKINNNVLASEVGTRILKAIKTRDNHQTDPTKNVQISGRQVGKTKTQMFYAKRKLLNLEESLPI